jgi:hypothetical protein
MLLLLGGHSHDSAKTHLQHLLIAVALNVARLVDWFRGHRRARTRAPHPSWPSCLLRPDLPFANKILSRYTQLEWGVT